MMCTNIAGLIMTNGFSSGAIKEWGMQMCRNSSLPRSLSEVIILSILTVAIIVQQLYTDT